MGACRARKPRCVTMTIAIAFYKAPGTWADKFIRVVTGSEYSHCEIIINGTAMSASARDGGVRFKEIAVTHEKWDIAPLLCDEQAVWGWFAAHSGCGYDWAGVLRFVLPFLPQRANQYFCSEACAAALGLPRPSDWTPGDLAGYFVHVFEGGSAHERR